MLKITSKAWLLQAELTQIVNLPLHEFEKRFVELISDATMIYDELSDLALDGQGIRELMDDHGLTLTEVLAAHDQQCTFEDLQNATAALKELRIVLSNYLTNIEKILSCAKM